jgi:hypothetical protein
MTDERKPKIENLELNRETVQDLAEGEAEAAQGGRLPTVWICGDFSAGCDNRPRTRGDSCVQCRMR